jgi:hypothetical protein
MQHGHSIRRENSMEEVPWYVSLIVSWLPFLLFMGATLWVGRRIGRELKTPDGRSLALVVDEYGKELKRSNDMLEQLLADYRNRLEAIERQN